jgi:alpha-amylase
MAYCSRPALDRPEQIIKPDDEPCSTNKTMFQGFEWYCPPDNKHWQRLKKAVPNLAALGVTSMWIPPAAKAGWRGSNGYDIYDLYDLGEFDQKGATCTKWGIKAELVDFVETANLHGMAILFDAILNHKAAADYTEIARAIKVDPKGNGPCDICLLCLVFDY